MIRILLFMTLVLALSPPLPAQEPFDMSTLNDVVAVQQRISEGQRTMIIADNLPLTASEADDFWPLYREYRAKVATLDERLIHLLQQFADNYASLDDRSARGLLKDSFGIEEDRIRLAQQYSGKFGRFLPGHKLVRFMQIEARLDAVLDLKLKNSIPLAN